MNQQRSTGINLVFLFPIVILLYTFSLFWGWVPRTHSIITLLIGLVVGIVVCNKFFTTKPFFYLLLYGIILFLNYLSGDAHYYSLPKAFYEFLNLLLPALISFGLFKAENNKIANFTVIAVLFMLIFNAIGSMYVDTVFPGSIRALNAETKITHVSSLQSYYFRFGVANYFLPHAIPMIIPVLIMGIRNTVNKKKKILLVSTLMACLIIVYLSGVTTALLLALFALIIAVATRKSGGNVIWLMVFFGLIYLLVLSNDEIMLSLLNWADNLIGGTGYFHSKIQDFKVLIEYDEQAGDIEARGEKYMLTIEGIMENPILGVNREIGGHTVFLDQWGYLGLVGFIPFMVFIISQVKMGFKYIQKTSRIFYLESVVIAFMMLSVKAIIGWEMWLFLFTVLPLLTIYCENTPSD